MAKSSVNESPPRKRNDGRWEARYTTPDGKRHSAYGKTKQEAAAARREVLNKMERGEYVKPDKLTLGVWIDRWFDLYEKPKIREKTAAVHTDNIRLHIKPALGDIPIQKLTTDQIQAFVNRLSGEKNRNTVSKILEPLKMCLKKAYQNRLISFNPAETIIIPPGPVKEVKALTLEEQCVLLEKLPDTTAGDAIRFILLTGLRASELCGLQWLDIRETSFLVQRGAVYVNGNLSLNDTKSKAGRRNIPLGQATVTILDRQRKRQLQQRLAAGSAWRADDAGHGDCFVFATEVGTAADKNNLGRVLRKTLKENELPKVGLHALRHSFITDNVRAGVDPRTLKELAGHAKISTTLQIYAHSDQEAKLNAVEAVADLIQQAK